MLLLPHCLVTALDHALLVVAGWLIVRVDDGVGGHAVGVVRLGPGVDGVDIRVGVKEESEHFWMSTCKLERDHTLCKSLRLTEHCPTNLHHVDF